MKRKPRLLIKKSWENIQKEDEWHYFTHYSLRVWVWKFYTSITYKKVRHD